MKEIPRADLEIALLYASENPDLTRGQLGLLLQREGYGLYHYLTNAGCADRTEYINATLDRIGKE